MKVLFTSKNLIGDALYISPALRAWIAKEKPDEVWMQTLPDHVEPLYAGMVRDLPISENFYTCFERPDLVFDFEHVFDVSEAFRLSDEKKQHLARSYADLLGVTLGPHDADVNPTYIPIEEPTVNPVHWQNMILVSMFSASCTSRDPKIGIPNKMLPWPKWKPMLDLVRHAYPDYLLAFIGAPTDRVPDPAAELLGITEADYITGIPQNRLALIMRSCKMVITIDNGMSHLAASQLTPTFLMYPKALGLHYILPVGNPNMTFVHMDPVYVSPAQLRYALGTAITIDKLVKAKRHENNR